MAEQPTIEQLNHIYYPVSVLFNHKPNFLCFITIQSYSTP